MKPIRLNENNIAQEVKTAILTESENLFYFVSDNTVVFEGYKNSLDKSFCDENGIFVVDVNNEGGVIVSGKGSLAVGHISKDLNNKFLQNISNDFRNFLHSKGLSASISENDILVNGKYKVASGSSRQFGNVLFTAFHISYEVDIDLIKRLCTKPMKKIPRGLKDYNIKSQEIFEFFLNFANEEGEING